MAHFRSSSDTRRYKSFKAKSVARKTGGMLNRAKSKNGWTVRNGNKLFRAMNKGSGGRPKGYFRMSVDRKGALTRYGKLSGDRAKTHINYYRGWKKDVIRWMK